MSMAKAKSTPEGVTLGSTVAVPAGAAMAVTDGQAVTVRRDYIVRTVGEHVFVNDQGDPLGTVTGLPAD